MDDILQDLNPAQREAVTATEPQRTGMNYHFRFRITQSWDIQSKQD